MTQLQKRIPVRVETWKQLSEIKEAGETYDELLEDLIEERKKARLFRRRDEILQNSNFTRLEDA